MPSREEARRTLSELEREIRTMSPGINSARFTSWHSRARSVLSKSLGAEHPITHEFAGLQWSPAYKTSDWLALDNQFRETAEKAQGYLNAAVFEMELLTGGGGPLDATGIDPELWEFVGADIEGEHWGKAATQTTLFLEDRIRRWTGQPAELVGEKLMSAVFGPTGNYRLGLTDGERDGWNLFAMGIFKALRNAAAHRIDTRPDHRRYVLGVLGACSLLLTQLRHEHADDFLDQSPAAPRETTDV